MKAPKDDSDLFPPPISGETNGKSLRFSFGKEGIKVEGYPFDAELRESKSENAIKLACYSLHKVDLRSALRGVRNIEALSISLDQVSDLGINRETLEIIFAGAVLAYCRCFDGAGARNAHPLTPSVVFGDHQDAIAWHQEIWNLRSKFFAHDVSDLRQSFALLVLEPDAAVADVLHFTATASVSREEDRLASFRALVNTAGLYVEQEIEKLVAAVKHEVEALNPERRLALPCPYYENPFPDTQARRRFKV